MDLGLKDIWFHDSVIQWVVEDQELDELGFEVSYPVDWENGNFEPRTIVFLGVSRYEVDEIPFAGKVTILDVMQKGTEHGLAVVRIETNAGKRSLLCSGVEIRDHWGTVRRRAK